MSSVRFFVGLVFGVLFSVSAHAQNPSAVQALIARLADITSVEGDFQQELLDETGAVLETSQGQFVLQKPGRFFWLTREPYEQQLISDGQTIWLYDPDLLQVTVRQADQAMDNSPAHLLSADAGTLSETYQVSRDGDLVFTLTPKEPQPLFETLAISFTEKSVAQIRLRDALGQSTVIHFSNTRVNQPVDESVFSFSIPADVDVLVD